MYGSLWQEITKRVSFGNSQLGTGRHRPNLVNVKAAAGGHQACNSWWLGDTRPDLDNITAAAG